MPHKNQHNSQPENSSQEDVAKWVLQLSGGSMTDRDLQEFQEWRRAKPENALAFEEMQELWQSDELTQALSRFELSQNYGTRHRKNTTKWWRLGSLCRSLAYASILLCLIGLTSIYWPQISSDYASHTGEIKQIELADGSTIYLDSKSALDVDFTPPFRNATLKEGRIHFDVHRDPQRPFVIQAQGNVIRVLGTAFDIDTRHNQTIVQVREGRVEVSSSNTKSAKIILKKGQAASFDTAGKFIKRSTAHQFIWLTKRIQFQNQTLAEIVNQLNDYSLGQIVIANEKIGSQRLTGSYSLADIDKTLKAISGVASAQLIGTSRFLAIIH